MKQLILAMVFALSAQQAVAHHGVAQDGTEHRFYVAGQVGVVGDYLCMQQQDVKLLFSTYIRSGEEATFELFKQFYYARTKVLPEKFVSLEIFRSK